MQRNIITTIEFATGHLSINVLEKLSNNFVEIYSAQESISKAHSFLNQSIEKVENLINGNIKEVTVIIEESQKVNASIELTKTSLSIVGDSVSQQDINNLIELTRNKSLENQKDVILVQPLQFEVEDVIKKQYSKAPLFKKGTKISATMAVTKVNTGVTDFINSVIKSQKLKISQIMLKSQAISQICINENGLLDGAILIHIGENQSFVSINKNCGTVSSMSFYEVGFKKLILGITKVFGCNLKDARELMTIYGDLLTNENHVIYTGQEGLSHSQFTMSDLKKIIESFTRRLLVLSKKYINQKNVEKLPIYFSGMISSVKGFLEYSQNIFEKDVQLFKPMTFVELNSINHNGIGFINWAKRLDEIYGKEFNTIVQTNPNTFASLKMNRKKRFSKFLNLIGGKYDRYN